LLVWAQCAWAQPPNDDCVNAISLPFGSNDFGLGVFTSPTTDLAGSTLQFGESLHPIQVSGGTDKKSVWYRFNLPTHRGVRLELKQNGSSIPQSDVGFTVYYNASCLPGLTAVPPAKLTPLNKFGNSFNPCLEPGAYWVQVTAKDNSFTNGSIFLELTLDYPSVLNNHDLHTSPQVYGTVSGDGNWTDFDVGCLTIEDTSENCPALGTHFREYTQSSWHTFTTDNAVDYVELEIRNQFVITGNPWTVGVNLYQGDASSSATPWTNLPLVDGCQTLSSTYSRLGYNCLLQPNTTYSIQFIYHKDLESTFGYQLHERGIGVTRGPDPTAIPASNQLGVLPGNAAGIWTYLSDTFACNARMVNHLCGAVVPTSYTYNGVTYDLNDWTTFTLSQASNVRFSLSSGCRPVMGRLYSGDVGSNCNLPLTLDFQGSTTVSCLPAGTYSLQMLGLEGSSAPLTCNVSHLAQPLTAGIQVTTINPGNRFDLSNAGAIDSLINGGSAYTPLPPGVTVYGQVDEFGCADAVLPAGNVCGNHSKAIYRVVDIAASGLLTVGGGNTLFNYQLYQGDAQALAVAQGALGPGNTINGLTSVMGCNNLGSPRQVCVDPGRYTLVSFGNNSDIGRSDQPYFRFNTVSEQFNLEAPDSVELVNNLLPLVSGLAYPTTPDRFDCEETVLPAGNVCSGSHNRAIYRVFTVAANGRIAVSGGSGNFRYSLYQGDANALATAQGAHLSGSTIVGLTTITSCQYGGNVLRACLTPGTYTLVTFGDDTDVNRVDQPTLRFDAYNSMFNLEATDSVEQINAMAPLVYGVTYNTTPDIFDCSPTVMPDGQACFSRDRALYREFTLNTTGLVTFGGGNATFGIRYSVYAGSANALATAQNVFSSPQTITGLTDLTGCVSFFQPYYLCLSPGTYTMVSYGNSGDIGAMDQPFIRLDSVSTLFFDPLNPDTLGDITSTGGGGTQDRFSCLDNPLTIDGQAPCNGATKQIYRTFFLSQPSRVSFAGTNGIPMQLFSGNSADGVNTLSVYGDGHFGTWGCFAGRTTAQCYPLQPGWYTLVSYGSASQVNVSNNVSISILPTLSPPNFNRPSKAYAAGITDYCLACDTGAYPVTKVAYNFGTEQFNCVPDTPFASHPIVGCDPSPSTFNRVAYYTFSLTQESYLRLRDIPSDMRVQLYDLDVRTDSSLFPTTTPIQNCITRRSYGFDGCTTWEGEIEFCRLQPGTYTFVIFASDVHIGNSLSPTLWVEKVENSRFDHAGNAYDFGDIPGDNTLYLGKVGEVNPLHAGRAASNDFFTCTTGAQPTDPGLTDTTYLCWKGLYKTPGVATVPYTMPPNYPLYEYNPAALDSTYPPLRRNLWYSFVVNGPGTVYVSAFNRTTGQVTQYPFSVYESDVDANLPWSTIQSTGAIDSTLADGLTFIGNNSRFFSACGCTTSDQTINFTRDACDGLPRRYYVVVDHHAQLELNNQLEVGIRYDSIPAANVVYDYFTFANVINGLNQTAPPYTNISLPGGVYEGAQGNYRCATLSSYDSNPCGDRTLWYEVEVGVSGLIRLQYATSNGDTTWRDNEMRLYTATTPGDSNSLVQIPLTAVSSNGSLWGQTCVVPGKYYVQMTGCGYTQEDVQPTVWIIDQPVEYDHYSEANRINGLGETMVPYTDVDLVSGIFHGDTASFACATTDPNDQNSCGTRTLWYAFDVAGSGKMRLNYTILGGGTTFNDANLMVFQEDIPGDSTASGLVQIPLNTVNANGQTWGEGCFLTGRYYVMLTGCYYTLQEVFPTLWLEEEPGDFCFNAIGVALNGADTANASAVVDCHSIGEAFGEDGSNMGCLFGPAQYKSTWFLVNLNTPQKVDLTFRLSETTNTSSTQIRYRILYGNCGAMTAGPCNTDALTEFTLNCMQSGDYYVQVITPDTAVGEVEIEVSTVLSGDQNCIPLNPSLPLTNFTDSTRCETDSVYFNNQSTAGPNIVYAWDFGDGSTSNAIHPAHLYPLTGTVSNYTVTLIATDTTTNLADTISIVVTTYPAPFGFITRDAPYDGDTLPGGVPLNFNSNASGTIGTPPTQYFWDFTDGQTSTEENPDSILINVLGTRIVYLTLWNGTCPFDTIDTFLIGLEPIFAGGPYDGADVGEFSPCSTDSIFAGGPYDGADNGAYSDCDVDSIFVGGPYDGADMGELTPCQDDSIFVGGPYDGADMGEFIACPPENIFAGGPYDGADMGEAGINIALLSGNDTLCPGDSATLEGVLTGGATANSWIWNTGDTTASITVAPIVSTVYTVTATLNNGCGDLTADFLIYVPGQIPVADAGPDITVCGTLPSTIGTAALAGLSYTWSPAADLSDPNLAQPIASPSFTTTYILTASNSSACPTAMDTMVYTVEPPAAVLAGQDTSICPGDTALLMASGADQYVWHDANAVLSSAGLTDALPATSFVTTSGPGGTSPAFSHPFGWVAGVSNLSQYVEIDLGAITPIHRVATRGASGFSTWVTSYSLAFSQDGITWYPYQTGSSPTIFSGNTDTNTPVYNDLPCFVAARYLRFLPVTWSTGGIGMRVDAFTAPELSASNPYPTSSTGSYVVHGQVNACASLVKDSVRVDNANDVALDYRTRRDGDWTDVTIWQVFDSVTATWIDAELYGTCGGVSYPTSQSLTIQVRDSVYYDFSIPVGIDETTIDGLSAHNSTTGGVIHIPLGIDLFLVDSSASPIPMDLYNQGRLSIAGDFVPVGAGLLRNTDPSTVAYVRNGNQTLWDGQYGRLEAAVGGVKTVGGASTLVRTETAFLGAHIQLNNLNIVLDTACLATNGNLNNGFFVTNAFGQVVKREIGPGNMPSFAFPIGHDVNSYNQAVLGNSGVTDVFSIRVSGSFEFHPNFPVDELADSSSVDRTWHLDEMVVGGSNLDLDVYWYGSHENAAFDRNACTVGRYDGTLGWERLDPFAPYLVGNTTIGPYHRSSSGILNTGPFSVGSCQLEGRHYRTISDGIWTDVGIWEVYDSVSMGWIPALFLPANCGAASYPTSASLTIQVRHDVAYNYTIPIGVDQVTITTVGHLTIPDSVNLILVDGPGSEFPTGINTRDIDNLGYFEIIGDFSVQPGALLVNDDLSVVHYNGLIQSMWDGYYGWLYVDGPAPINATTKSVSGSSTFVKTGLDFRNAKIALGNFDLELDADASVLNPGQNTGYMIATANGYCVWNYNGGFNQAHLFPVGGNVYSPATIDFDLVTGSGTLKGRVREMQHPTRFTINRYWTMDLGTMAFSGFYDGTFQYDHGDLPTPPITPAIEYDQVEVGGVYNPAYSAPNGWRLSPVYVSNVIDINANTGTIRNDAFSDFTFMPVESILPTELTLFTGQWEGLDALLEWRAESEGNMIGYVLERSLNGNDFDSLTFVEAVGGLAQVNAYEFLDQTVRNQEEDLFHYRLRMLDLDGSVSYSNVVILKRDRLTEEEYLTLYPNPVGQGNSFNFQYYVTQDRSVQIDVFDVVGKRIFSTSEQFTKGLNERSLPTNRLAIGTYYIRFQTTQGNLVRKLLVR